MKKVYLVYYDNGQRWEESNISVNKIFASKEDAEIYARGKNAALQIFTPSVSKEKYIAENYVEHTGYSWEEFLQSEQYDWSLESAYAKYSVSEEEVF